MSTIIAIVMSTPKIDENGVAAKLARAPATKQN
jgi:hypothetical protein